jgi:hypothetical protein
MLKFFLIYFEDIFGSVLDCLIAFKRLHDSRDEIISEGKLKELLDLED